jgi:hypothetical protein
MYRPITSGSASAGHAEKPHSGCVPNRVAYDFSLWDLARIGFTDYVRLLALMRSASTSPIPGSWSLALQNRNTDRSKVTIGYFLFLSFPARTMRLRLPSVSILFSLALPQTSNASTIQVSDLNIFRDTRADNDVGIAQAS